MAYERRSYTGAAAITTIAFDITASETTITIVDAAGWPTGSGGPFAVAIDPESAQEEKVLVTSRSGTVLTLSSSSQRGYDNGTAQSHSAGATIYHSFTSVDADEANATAVGTLGKIAAKGDFLAGTGPNALGRVPAGVNGQLLLVDSAETAGVKYGALPDNAVSTSAKFAPGVVDTAALADDAVSSAKLQASSVQTAHIGDAQVTTAKIAALNVTTGTMAASAVTTAKIADANVTTAKIADAAVTTDKLVDNAVTTAKITDGNVTQAKLASGMRAPVVCTSGTRPTAVEGLMIYETDTDLIYFGNGTDWSVMPGQRLGSVVVGTNATTPGLHDCGLTLTFTMPRIVGSRRVLVTGYVPNGVDGGGGNTPTLHDVAIMSLKKSDNTVLATASTVTHGVFGVGYHNGATLQAELSNSSVTENTSVTVKLTVETGTGHFAISANSVISARTM